MTNIDERYLAKKDVSELLIKYLDKNFTSTDEKLKELKKMITNSYGEWYSTASLYGDILDVYEERAYDITENNTTEKNDMLDFLNKFKNNEYNYNEHWLDEN
jgi:DNA-binding ferritin-like protein (Dps family)